VQGGKIDGKALFLGPGNWVRARCCPGRFAFRKSLEAGIDGTKCPCRNLADTPCSSLDDILHPDGPYRLL
jgi:hypothetical protein